MFVKRQRVAVWLVAASILGPVLHARAEESPTGLEQKLRALESEIVRQREENRELLQRVGELEARQEGSWLNARRAEEVKALIRQVLSDADTRASLTGDGIAAGHNGKNFFLASEDDAFLLNFSGQFQVRYLYNSRDRSQGAATALDDDGEAGFQIRRAKISFEGHVGSPRLTYALQLAGNRDSSAVEVESAYVGFRPFDPLNIIGGRFSSPFLRDQMASSKTQLAVERTLIAAVFGAGRNYVEGVGFEYDPIENLRLRASVNDGLGSGNPGGTATGFLNGPNDFNNDSTDIAGTFRADLKLMGDWKQFTDYSAWSGEKTAAFIGGAVHYELAESGEPGQVSGSTPVTGPYDDFITWTVDGSVESGGLNVMGAFVANHIHVSDGNPLGDLDSYAAMGQVGYMLVPDKFEPFARYEWIAVDKRVASDEINIVTLGANYYFKKHSAKFTADVVWVMDPLNAGNTLGVSGAAGTGLTGLGLLADAPDADDQVAIRAQFQLLF